ncbi:MAG: nucleotidyltransferase family protein [Chloroflexota bacterium]|nr:nucleotidyltransferase family protein [Chloroflexota bacterium]
MTDRAAGIILAAGQSTRFGADKLAARWRGKLLLQHVLDAATTARLSPLVVVVGPRRRAAPLDWHGAHVVVNRHPERGLSRSLQLGLRALSAKGEIARAVVLLGDQPLVSPAVIARLLAEPLHAAQPILVPRYADGQPGNPVVLERAAWPLARALAGDRGMAQLFAARPDLVRYLGVPGDNPDIDTPADLAALNRA